jgi:hypothetical protein
MDAEKLFACGTDPKQFLKKFNKISNEEQDLISRVADRAWVTLLLRYETTINPAIFLGAGGYSAQYQINVKELPSIEVYLLFSCLDTLTGSNYKNFEDWLDDQKITKKLSKEKIKSLYDCYKKEHGVTKYLRKLFSQLPVSTQDWLFRNICIIKEDGFIRDENKLVDRQKFLNALFHFFYGARNSFTHQSKPQPSNISKDIFNPNHKNNFISGRSFLINHKKWQLYYRYGLDDATILRVIIYTAVLQKLQIQVTDDHINAHMGHLARLNSFIAFINEVQSNASYLEAISNLSSEENNDLRSLIYHAGFHCLNNMATFEAIKLFEIKYTFESGMCNMAKSYFKLIVKINKKIIKFNKDFCSQQKNRKSLDTIYDFIKSLIIENPFKEIKNWPKKTEMKNLWLIITNPCYS